MAAEDPDVARRRTSPLRLVVMGVSGNGKSTLGTALAQALDIAFVEGDTLHPPANIAKMTAGVPLDDEDRAPFIAAVGEVLRTAGGAGVVVTCSALKRRYRDTLRAAEPDVRFILPMVGRDALARRLAQRRDHFMPASLLDSQLADFEPPGPDEAVIRVDGALAPSQQVVEAIKALGATSA